MMEAVRAYLLRLTAGALLSAGVLALIPKGTVKKAAVSMIEKSNETAPFSFLHQRSAKACNFFSAPLSPVL